MTEYQLHRYLIAANALCVLLWLFAIGSHVDSLTSAKLFVADWEFALALAGSALVVVNYRIYNGRRRSQKVDLSFQVSTIAVTLAGIFLCFDGVFASAFEQMFQSLLWIDLVVGIFLTVGAQFVAFDMGLYSIFGVERRD